MSPWYLPSPRDCNSKRAEMALHCSQSILNMQPSACATNLLEGRKQSGREDCMGGNVKRWRCRAARSGKALLYLLSFRNHILLLSPEQKPWWTKPKGKLFLSPVIKSGGCNPWLSWGFHRVTRDSGSFSQLSCPWLMAYILNVTL